jgi:hypothetical protein
MTSFMKRTVASLAVGTAVVLGVATPASAQPIQDGLVNVNVGDVTILEDVRVGLAAQVAAQICGVRVGPVAVLATLVDRTGATRTVCTIDQGPVTIDQNH